jgi:hypothetical protein
VFSTKPYDYLKIAFNGGIPWYDKTNQKWVQKTDFDTDKATQETAINDNIKKVEAQFVAEIPTVTPTPIETSIPTVEAYSQRVPLSSFDDDLPF